MADMTLSIAFIGMGVMGRPMAGHLVAAGHRVTAYLLHGAPDERFETIGGRTARTIADAVRDADLTITMLPDSPDVLSVASGPDGVLAHARRGSLYIDMSTISPQVAQRLAEEGAAHDVAVLDAPVSGGEKGAVDAALSIMVGGDEATFDRALPVLEAMGTTVRRMGGAGAGQTVKAANQLIVASNLQALAEAIVFLEASGVDALDALDALGGGLAGSTVLQRRGAAMLGRDYAPGFRTDLHHKDLGILISAAREVGVPLPVGSTVAQLIASLRARGGGGLDHTALRALAEDAAGRRPLAEATE